MNSDQKSSRLKTIVAVCLLVALVTCFSDFARLANPMRAATPVPVQLVRLSFSSNSGMVRIEITADGSLNDLSIEHFTRGHESVIRIVGASSLLHPSYDINDSLASAVRTVAGVHDNEPFVDIIITTGQGATIAQKRSFNRLVIGIASDFARLRHRAPSGASDVAVAARAERRESSGSHEVPVNSTPVTDAMPTANSNLVMSNASPENHVLQPVQPLVADDAPPVEASGDFPTLPVFRARATWSDYPVAMRAFTPRLNISGLQMLKQTSSAALSASATPQDTLWTFAHGELDAPGSTPGVWVPGTTAARRDEIGGRPLGAGFLRPAFILGAEFDDNFFYRSQRGENFGVFTFAPRIEYEIPGEDRAMRVAIEPRLRRLTNAKWANGFLLDYDVRTRFGHSFRLAFRDHFMRSPLDPREYDPAGETYIVGDTFTRNDGALRGEYGLSARDRLAFDLGYNLVRWKKSDIAHSPLFLDYDELTSAVSYERDVSETTTTTATFAFSTTNTEDPLRPQFNGLNDRERFAVELGSRIQMTETAGFAFRAGFERSLYRHAPSANNYSGLVFDMLFRRDFSKNMNFELSALRKTQVSAFNLEGGNARLTSTGGALHLGRKQSEALNLGLGLSYQRLNFPVGVVADSTASGGVLVGAFSGLRRRDNLFGFSFDAAYEWTGLFSTRFVYSFSRRDSNIPVLSQSHNRLSLVLEFGRRNDVRGRPF